MKNKKNAKKSRKKNAIKKVANGVMVGVITFSAVAPTMAVNAKAVEETSVFSSGQGTEESPFVITDSTQMAKIIDFPTSYFILGADVNYLKMPLNPIGDSNNPFKGVFDGNGYSISNFTLTDNAVGTPTGLFSAVDGATIKNLSIEEATVSNSRSKMGVLVGLAKNPTLQNIKVKNSHVSALADVWSQATGLLVGSLEGVDNGTTVIENIEIEGNVDGYGYVGGLIGKVTGSFKTGSISNIDVNATLNGQGMEDNVGGLIGLVDASNISVNNIMVDGEVIGSEAVGGLIGQVSGVSSNSVIKNVITKPIIKGTDANSNIYLGGLIGTDGGGIRESIFVASPSIENPTASINTHVIFGNSLSSNHLYYDTKYLKTINLKGTSTEKSGITFPTYTDVQKVQKETYADFDFGNVWGMYDGKSEPFLLFSMTDAERAEWEKEHPPVDIYKDARLAVENAENTKLQEDVNIAQEFVTKLPASEEKTNLQNRLNEVQDVINKVKAIDEATSAVKNAETSKTREDLNTAQDLVNALPSSEEKTVLENRLNELLTIIEQAEADTDALNEATKAVGKAEASRVQSDIDKAQELITALKPSEEKEALQAQLDDLIQRIENYKIVNAMQAVDEAEKTRLKADIDKAQELVTALKPSDHKDKLQERLEALNKSIEEDEKADKEAVAYATQSVETAETTRLQADIDTAQNLVTALKPSEEKDALQTRLDSLRQAIEAGDKESLAQVTQAVGDAESTRLQVDIDTAQNMVTALKPSEEKDALQTRLDVLRQSIEDEKVNAEALAQATQSVETAETTRLQADIDKAQNLVTSLKSSKEKNVLQTRLDALRQSIAEEKEADAEALLKGTKAVEKAESSHLQSDVDSAQILLDTLKVSAEKDALQVRLDAVQEKINQELADQKALSKATNAVETAETTRLQSDVDTAKSLVGALKQSEEKDALQTRLDALSKSINEEKENEDSLAKATHAIEKAEISRSKSDVDTAQGLVNALKPSAEKTALQARLDTLSQSINEETENVEALAKATSAVEKAEETRKQADVDTAQNLVTVLKSSTEKTTLQARLDALRNSIEAENTENEALAKATQGVVIAESTRLQADIDKAQKMVDALKSNSAKDALQSRLDVLNKSIADEKEKEANAEALTKATQAVEKAENTRLQSDIDIAKGLVDKLPTSDSKVNLKSRLDAIKVASDKDDVDKEAIKTATKAVEKAETTLSQSDIDNAQRKVTALVSSPEKTVLQSRLDALQNIVNKQNTVNEALAKATQTVVKAESTRLQSDINTARESVTKLSNGKEKDALNGRLDALQKSIDREKADKEGLAKATKAVEVAVSTKLQKDINIAQDLVTALSGSESKYLLQQRINAINSVIQIDKDGTVTAVFKSPNTQQLVVGTDDFEIELVNEYQDASKVKVVWKTVAGNKRQLQVIADGKEIESFKKPAKVSVKLPKAYLVREVTDGDLRAILYKYEQGRFVFETNIANDVYMFTTKQRSFNDVNGDNSQTEINELASRYVIYGTSPTTFAPNKDITRGQFSALIARALGLRTEKPTTFTDMQGHWFAGEVQALKDIGIVQGKDANTFDPNATLTRQQTALIISRLLEYLGSKVPFNNPTFNDNSDISEEAWKAVGQLQSAGIISSTKGNKFEPNSNLTRAQMAKVLYNTLDVAGYMSDKKTK